MEVFGVYALVGVFFFLTGAFVIMVLAHQPYRDPLPLPLASAAGSSQKVVREKESKIVYAMLALFFLLLCVTALVEEKKERTTHSAPVRPGQSH